MSKDVILTGIRSNDEPTIGNYLGAFLPMVELQKKHAGEYQLNMFVPDLHSFTTPIDHGNLYDNTIKNLKYFVAAGLDIQNPDTFIYRQSYIPAHSELTWILDCFSGMGEISRMTQYKEKGENQASVSVGLFNYPVLMAADILLYGAKWVPVGEDQRQHVEFARDLAIRMNNKFGELFVLPEDNVKQTEFAARSEPVRIRSLRTPEKKMSKSVSDPAGTILLSDNPEEAAKKVMSATTDSLGSIQYDWQKQPGVTNLLQILVLLGGKSKQEVTTQWEGKSSYGELKSAVAEEVKNFLADFQQKLSQVNHDQLMKKLGTDEATMREVANSTLSRVQRAVGLRPKRGKEERKRAGSVLKPAAVDFNDFSKLDIRIGTIIEAKEVADSDKLIQLMVNLGTEQRNIVTGMREFYKSEDFIGKQVPVIINLQPQTFKGVKSHGMLLAIEGQDGPVMLKPENSVPSGSPIE